jgi:hypothetical protein
MKIVWITVVISVIFAGCDLPTSVSLQDRESFTDIISVENFREDAAIGLSWRRDAGAERYIVKRSKDGIYGAGDFEIIYEGGETSYTDRNVEAGIRYLYRLDKAYKGNITEGEETSLGVGTRGEIDLYEPNNGKETAVDINGERSGTLYFYRYSDGRTLSDSDWYKVWVESGWGANVRVIETNAGTENSFSIQIPGKIQQSVIHNETIRIENDGEVSGYIYFGIYPEVERFVAIDAYGGAIRSYKVVLDTVTHNDIGDDENDTGNDEDDSGDDENDTSNDEDDSGEDENDSGNDEENTGDDENETGNNEDDSGNDENDTGDDENEASDNEDDSSDDGDNVDDDENETGNDEENTGNNEDDTGEGEDNTSNDENDSGNDEENTGDDENETSDNEDDSGRDEDNVDDDENETGNDEENTGGDENETGNDENDSGDDEDDSGDDEENTGDDDENETGNDEDDTGDDEDDTDDDEENIGEDENDSGNDENETGNDEEDTGDDENETGNDEDNTDDDENDGNGDPGEIIERSDLFGEISGIINFISNEKKYSGNNYTFWHRVATPQTPFTNIKMNLLKLSGHRTGGYGFFFKGGEVNGSECMLTVLIRTSGMYAIGKVIDGQYKEITHWKIGNTLWQDTGMWNTVEVKWDDKTEEYVLFLNGVESDRFRDMDEPRCIGNEYGVAAIVTQQECFPDEPVYVRYKEL